MPGGGNQLILPRQIIRRRPRLENRRKVPRPNPLGDGPLPADDIFIANAGPENENNQ
jgi:hypothetical protein